MTRYISKLQAVNWNRGLHRVFALLCVLWVGSVFIWVPIEIRNEAQKHAYETYIDSNNKLNSPEEQIDIDLQFKQNLKEAEWASVYKIYLDDPKEVILATVMFPAAFYVLSRLLIMLLVWIYRGFNTPKEGA